MKVVDLQIKKQIREDSTVAHQFKQMESLCSKETLLKELNHKMLWVRRAAAEELRNFKNKETVKALTRKLDEKDNSMRYAVIASLGEIGDDYAVPALKKAFVKASEIKSGKWRWDIKECIVNTLEKMSNKGSKSAVNALKGFLKKEDDLNVKQFIRESLKEIENDQSNV